VLLHHPSAFLDKQQRIISGYCRATDSLGFSLFAKEMLIHVGCESVPSVTLLDRHVRWLDRDLDRRYRRATTPGARRELAQAGLTTLIFWLGWLRSTEGFSLRWDDVAVTPPPDGPSLDLPPGIGALILTLLPETKTSRALTADVVLAYTTMSGFSVGKWHHRAHKACHARGTARGAARGAAPGLIFSTPDGTQWTSAYFRTTLLYPALDAQRRAGDAFLQAFDGSPGNSIAEKYWSMHCYRRGATTEVTRGRLILGIRLRKASGVQTYEHACWRRKRSFETIDAIYRQWTIPDRITLTLFCK
jgi:hypothetical protein